MLKNLKIKNNKTILIALIAITFFLLEILIVSLAFYSQKKQSYGEIQLGELDFEIKISLTDDIVCLPGDSVNLSIEIVNKVLNKTNLIPFYFRFKILNGNEDFSNEYFSLENAENFVYDGNYFYYKHKMEKFDTAKLINQIVIPTYFNYLDAENFNLQVLVDAVQSEFGAYKEVFPDAPQEWTTFIENN